MRPGWSGFQTLTGWHINTYAMFLDTARAGCARVAVLVFVGCSIHLSLRGQTLQKKKRFRTAPIDSIVA